MKRLSSLIRSDKEFSASMETMREQLRADVPYPIVINGLTNGAASAYLTEAIKEVRLLTSAPVLIIVASEAMRERCVSELRRDGVNALEYKTREFVFHNVKHNNT